MRIAATMNEDLNDQLHFCRGCARKTIGLVQVSLGDVWIGCVPLCDECQDIARDACLDLSSVQL